MERSKKFFLENFKYQDYVNLGPTLLTKKNVPLRDWAFIPEFSVFLYIHQN